MAHTVFDVAHSQHQERWFTLGGQFYRPGATLKLPVYLEAEVQNRLTRLANGKGVDFSTLALLHKDLELIEMAQ